MRENPNPAIWRYRELTINLARVVSTARRQLVADGEEYFCVLFDVPYTHGRSAGSVSVVESFIPMPIEAEQIQDFLRALEMYHSKA